MEPRLNPYRIAPDVMKGLLVLESHVQSHGLEPALNELVKTRASQINGCAFCIQMHSAEARAKGETAERLLLLDAWRESPLYSERERAALAWTESVTLAAQTHIPDAAYLAARAAFSEEELVKLTLVIATVNVWNRFGIGFRSVHPVKPAHAAE